MFTLFYVNNFTWCNFHINSIPYHQVFVPPANIFKALSSRLQMIALFARFSKELFNKKLENFNWSSLWKILLYDSTEGLLNTLNKLWQKKKIKLWKLLVSPQIIHTHANMISTSIAPYIIRHFKTTKGKLYMKTRVTLDAIRNITSFNLKTILISRKLMKWNSNITSS